jgi:hypothetical protein
MYREKIARLDEQSQEVGSHSVGHLPDFDELPMGELGETKSSYSPDYSGGSTQGGTLLGDLEVSKQLLERDVPQNINVYRSGHLIYHEKLINALDTLDYKFNSTFSSNNILTSFPYKALKDRSFNGVISDVWGIPLLISDIIDKDFTPGNYEEVVDMWLEVSEKQIGNSAPVVLLIHPNNDLKLKALQQFINQLPNDVEYQSMKSFGNFWLRRNSIDYYSELHNNVLTIHLENEDTLPDDISIKVNDGKELDDVIIYGSSGDQHSYRTQTTKEGDVLVYSQTTGGNQEQHELTIDRPLKMYPNYPNPFHSTTTITYNLKKASEVTIEVFNSLGKKIETIISKRQDSGTHWIELNANGYASGVYFYRITVNSYSKVGKMLYIK